ncbi:hypothetical protein ACWERY_10920 [Streptomyces sp. NPDC004082]|uniref:hypothetical protein n=1 Tax=unclassified Streptomyces TaxID=2593676 RepID=UPI0033B4114D
MPDSRETTDSFEINSRQVNSSSSAGNAMNKDDELVLRQWCQNLVFQDQRYKNKAIFKLAALAMGNDEIRWRLVNDTESILSEFRSKLDLPEGTTLRFWDNTPDTLHVVLPPRPGEASKRSAPLREALRSETIKGEGSGFGRDDFRNHGDAWDDFGTIDRGDHKKDGH